MILGDFLVNFEWNQVGLFNVNGNKTSSPVTNGIGQIWFFLIIPFCYSLFALHLKDERNISSKNQTNNGETSRNAKWIHVRVRVLGEKGGGGARGLLSPTFRRRDVTCGGRLLIGGRRVGGRASLVDSNVFGCGNIISRVEHPVLSGAPKHRFNLLNNRRYWIFICLIHQSDDVAYFLGLFKWKWTGVIFARLLLLLFDMQIKMSIGDCNRHSCQWHTILKFVCFFYCLSCVCVSV